MQPFIKKALVGIGIIVGISFFISHRILFFKPGYLEDAASRISYPFISLGGKLAAWIHSWKQERYDYNTLRERYHRLSEEYHHILNDVIELRSTEHIYNQVKELCVFREHYAHLNALLAKILIKHIASTEHYYLINRGSRDGIAKDMVAFYERHLVGKVTDVFDSYSKIKLITDQHCKVAAYTSKTHAHGIVQGFNSINRCSVNYLSHLFKIIDHDLVISSGQGLIFPEGFCLGKIVNHTLKEKELYHAIEIEPCINFATLTHCLLVDGKMVKQF